jgi:hypothetical protein
VSRVEPLDITSSEHQLIYQRLKESAVEVGLRYYQASANSGTRRNK